MRIFTWLFWLGLLLLTSNCVFSQETNQRPWESVTNYDEHSIQGWRVLVNKKLTGERELSENVLKLLDAQLFQITRVVPSDPLAKLRQVPIWVELSDKRFPCVVYHESADWLREHGVNPEKASAIEIANPQNFLTWTREQPWMILHELAHGYHQRFLGEHFERIHQCFQKAKESGRYESILRINGKKERHYAMTNEKEYFAEMTEAFFGMNDFYPFVRAELKEFDPEVYSLLREVWGVENKTP